MHPLLPFEMKQDYKLETVLAYGSLAVFVGHRNTIQEHLKSYVTTYLKEEIQAEALVRNLSGFSRFLPVASLFHAQTINISNIARECGVERTTVAGFLDILEDTLLTFRLGAYEAKLRVKERKLPKLYWYDNGIVRAIKNQLGPINAEEKGTLFEGWVAQILKAYQHYHNAFDQMFYWGTNQNTSCEVDFLVQKDKYFYAFECKSSHTIRDDHLKGLRQLSQLPNLKKRFVVYMGKEILKTNDGIVILPALEFEKRLSQKKIF